MPLTPEQRQRIEENRRKALERLQQRKNGNAPAATPAPAKASTPATVASTSAPASTAPPTSTASAPVSTPSKEPSRKPISVPELPRLELTPEQRQRIQKNRERALQIQQQRQKNSRDGTANTGPVAVVTDQERKRLKPEYNPPSIQKKDYIEYDFATMSDSKGGFLDETKGNGMTTGPEEEPQSLTEWKEKQKQELMVKELAPPLDLANAPKCVECDSLEIDANFFTNFGVKVCRRCAKEKPEKYSLLTKTECREDYLLTEPELKDTSLLRRIEKPNPHGFSRMQLFLRLQVEEFAWKKWGSAEGLDQEWERREKARLDRREKRYQDKMKEMRKKTRAEEYTRKLRNGQALGERHVHQWSAPVAVDEKTMKRRCMDCGIETEEIMI